MSALVRHFAVAALTALPVLACIKVKAAPESLETAIKSYWTAYEGGDDAAIRSITRDLDALVPAFVEQSEEPGVLRVRGRIGLLDREHLAAIGMADKGDPATAPGVIVFAEIGCPLEKVERYVVARNQLELYPGVYTKYDRSYTSSADEYFSRKAPKLTWKTEYSADVLGKTTYDATVVGTSRWIPGTAAAGAEGPVLLARTHMPEPAKVAQADKYWKQDYQMEAYYEREPGKTVHLYGLWRDFNLGYTMNDDSAVNFVLANLIEFDNQTTKLCATGSPAPN